MSSKSTAKASTTPTVRLGGMGPLIRVADGNKVRIGGFGPLFRIQDAGKVRIGGFGPLFR